MSEPLTEAGFRQTKQKLARLEERLASLSKSKIGNPRHLAESRRSYERMAAQYRREIKLYEASHSDTART